MRWLLEWSFGCRHANTSFPQTVPSQRVHPAVGGHPNAGGHSNVGGHSNAGGHHNVAAVGGHPAVGAKVTYVTCLSCGQEFNYCWRTMQRLSSAPAWIEEQITGNRSSRELQEIEELRHLWMT
jgi:hypothetical protein